MKRIGVVIASAFVTVGLLGCQPANDSVNEKLDKIAERLDGIEAQLKKGVPAAAGARGAAPQRPQRARPNPTDVFAVPIEGAPSIGPQSAKVTIVEAFEFA